MEQPDRRLGRSDRQLDHDPAGAGDAATRAGIRNRAGGRPAPVRDPRRRTREGDRPARGRQRRARAHAHPAHPHGLLGRLRRLRVDTRLYEREPRHPDPNTPSWRSATRASATSPEHHVQRHVRLERRPRSSKYLRTHYDYSSTSTRRSQNPSPPSSSIPLRLLRPFRRRHGRPAPPPRHPLPHRPGLLRRRMVRPRIRHDLPPERLHAWVEVWLGSMAAGSISTPPVDAGGRRPRRLSPAAARPPPQEPARPGQPATALSAEKLSNRPPAQGQLISSFWNSVAAFWKSRAGKLLVFALVLASSVFFTWRTLPRHEKSRLRALLLVSPGASTPFYDEFLTLAARAGLRPETGETAFEFGKRVERVYPGARKVSLALYAVRFGEAPLADEEAKARPVIDGMRAAQAGASAVKVFSLWSFRRRSGCCCRGWRANGLRASCFVPPRSAPEQARSTEPRSREASVFSIRIFARNE